MVRLRGINKSFGAKVVLHDFSLEIGEGERFVLLGPSGCGKTTLLRLIAGFETPDTGSITIDGSEVTGLPAEQRPVGFIFQRHALFPHMTVYDNIAVGPRLRGVAESDIAREIGRLLALTHLEGLEHAWPGRLSGGESQRVALARALINKPKVLLLDEPLSALDEGLRQTLRNELADMQRAFGITFLFVTHDQQEAMALADRMTILEAGRALQVGTPESLYNRPENPFVARFLGEVNRFEAVAKRREGHQWILSLPDGGEIRCPDTPTLTAGVPVECYIRPEKLSIVPTLPEDPSLNRLQGTLTHRVFFGNRTVYQVQLSGGERIAVLSFQPDKPLKLGQPVFIVFQPDDLLFVDPAPLEAV